MDSKVVVPEKTLNFDSGDVLALVQQARDADAADKALTIKQALKKYKKAVFWAMILSTSLIMEGYDLVIVCTHAPIHARRRSTYPLNMALTI